MNLNNKGWGTAEMLGLCGGLFIALLVAIYFISQFYGSLNDTIRNRQYSDLQVKLENAAIRYVVENNVSSESSEYIITLKDLMNSGYIKSFADESGNSCTGYVKVSKIDAVNEYKGYIKCNNYISRDY